ncbi:glycosyltransferase family 2 protein [Sulfoacidibacillus ferrooxidans]|uniref:Glycosyltransferase 2-like domain-containing protein n=1 Tax=Sulfoacidibacillus ferrooxidans TaxID=2005001 RepID=A0A9X2ADI2_9BACL|nr:glycosyltransferase family 2 protein [Sulfoacidibacillus ferrooxidans]MCI0183445.1 hypothetical protein [Sulfoacidibacillus ferrooxidans]
MTLPTVSVIIPVHNGRTTIGQTINAIEAQSIPTEIIVIDDGSTDQTTDLIKLFYPQVKCIRQEHKGPSAARNTGIQMATGDYVAFCDADDVWLPNKLQWQCAVLEHEPQIDMLVSQVTTDPNQITRNQGPWPLRPIELQEVLEGSPLPSTAIMRAGFATKIGAWDESLPVLEDLDYFARAAKIGLLVSLHLPLVYYRVRTNSLSHHTLLNYAHLKQVLARFVKDGKQLNALITGHMHGVAN